EGGENPAHGVPLEPGHPEPSNTTRPWERPRPFGTDPMPVPTIVIFGASGDLTSRKLVPALFRLDSTGLLPAACHVVGMARTAFTSEEFRQQLEPKVKEAIVGNGESWYPGTWGRFAKRLHYVAGDAARPDGMRVLIDWLKKREGDAGGDRLYYLSV